MYLLVCLAIAISLVHGTINRKHIVESYNVVRHGFISNETVPLQVGNGDFAFSVDSTGLQTFIPFNTMASWAWHNDSLPTDGEQLSDYHGVDIITHGRDVYYDIPDPELPSISQWIISNPNKINLGRIALKFANASVTSADLSDIRQELHLYTGLIVSTFTVLSKNVTVQTRGDFDSDSVAISIESDLVKEAKLSVYFDFPYPPIHSADFKFEVFVGSYDFPLNHTTQLLTGDGSGAHIYHEMQDTKYFLNLAWERSSLNLTADGPLNSSPNTAHRYTLSPTDHSSSSISFTANFALARKTPHPPSDLATRNTHAWAEYWENGGFVDLTGSSNPAAPELQRRIVQSLYHVRVNSAGVDPPQESGLINNGWYGKFHLEMLIWHLAHWNTWSREQFINRIVPAIYEKFLPSSTARAKAMGWKGARWPKMTDPLTGRSSPGSINGQLLWQQPHPMYLATLEYYSSPTKKTLKRWDNIISHTADYMASFAWYNNTSGNYDIGPPAYGVTENTPPNSSLNLAYEIAYWRYGLDVAASWKRKLGEPVPNEWTKVASQLASPPKASDNSYVVYEGLDLAMWNDSTLMGDPRSLIMIKGFLPDTPAIDDNTARNTAQKVWDGWQGIYGWGRPALAMNAARLGEPERAITYLTDYDEWIFDDAGFAVRGGGSTPPPFMPGNAGFLLAISYMIAGWHGGTTPTPGFPNDGSWSIKYENLRKAP